jgi:protein-disulfide isomerase
MSVDRVLRAGLMSLVLVSSAASAQTPIQAQPDVVPLAPGQAAAGESVEGNPLANRPQVAAVLRFLQSQGVKLTTLGTEGGLPGYLGESPNSRMQVFYITPDGSHVIAGLMFDAQGANVTGVQLGEMQRRFESAQKQLSPATTPAPAAASSSQPLAAPAPVPAPTLPPTLKTGPSSLGEALQPKPPAPAPDPLPVPAAAPAQQAPKASSAAPLLPQQQTAAASPSNAIAAPSTAADKYVSALDRGAVERALRDVPWFQVGVKEAPALYVVVDPQCPFCHAAWQRLQPYVYGKKLQLRIIMIAGLKGSAPLAISILSRQNPGEAWLAGEGSLDNFAIAPPPEPNSQQYQSAQKYLDMNAGFVRTFGISSTPTFLYFGKDERLFSSIGLPEDADAFMAALN